MKRKPTTYTVPLIRNARSGLIMSRGVWKAHYTVDGKPRYKSMRTKDLATATLRRDEFYASLDCPVTHGEGDRFLYPLSGYVVRIRGKYIGTFQDREDAIAARDKELG